MDYKIIYYSIHLAKICVPIKYANNIELTEGADNIY